MKVYSNVTIAAKGTPGLFWGALGVLIFSFSLPATRVAVTELDPWIVGLGRAVAAALLAGLVLLARGEALLPPRRSRRRVAMVGFGVVIGFPLFSALALRQVGAAHAAVIVGLLPAATAVAAVVRAGERPSRSFWFAALLGLTAVLVFAATRGAAGFGSGDGLVLLAVASAALGYAEGGALAREYGGVRVICWALILSFPILAPVVIVQAVTHGLSAGWEAWMGFAYVSLFSMFLGFFAWYRGLSQGGVARISQVQLSQPLLTLLWSVLLLGEHVDLWTLAVAAVVILSVAVSQRARVERRA
ncbi:DMT family transporter [Haliangium sp.]|uniref:DMT family transporter n=1 Tax=Haliangium sp. TaxID=2663208 RepID=UPI003D0F114D